MPYDASKDKYAGQTADAYSYGAKGAVVVPSDTVDLDPYAKSIVVTAAGNLVILPAANDDGATITFTDCGVGFSPPYRVRRVMATGTTATVATIAD